jgi:signal peptidase II
MFSALASGGMLLLLDRWSKQAVELRFPEGPISWGPLVQIRYVIQARAYYKRKSARVALFLLWTISLISAVALRRSGLWFQSPAALIGLGLAFGGAAGNLLDVFKDHQIVDFVDLHWWPVFNLADLGIVGGLLLAFLA